MNDEIQNFIDAYRDSLGKERDITLQSLENSRRNAFQNIMSSANTAGMMYSNFPERAKIQYDAEQYMPARAAAQSTYQTGLDKLRMNTAGYLNQMAELREAISDLNKTNDPMSKFAINDASDYAFWDDSTGTTQYRNANKEKIRFGTAAKRAGYTDPADILNYASQTLKGEDEINRLNDIWKRAKEQGMTGITYNVGDNFQMPAYNFLTDAENDFLGSLGLSFQ